MAKAKKIALSPSEQVSDHIASLDAENGAIVQYLRELILSADKLIAEHIKWNSPAFYYTGEMAEFDAKEYKRDLVVMNLHRGRILLVFPTGESVKDVSPILEGKYTDGRRLVTITDMEDARAKEKELKKVIEAWLKQVD